MSLGGTQPLARPGAAQGLPGVINCLIAVVDRLNLVLRGKINCTGDTNVLTFTAAAVTTTLIDERIGPNSIFILTPTNTTAAVTAWYASSTGQGTVTFTHSGAASADRTFRYAILG